MAEHIYEAGLPKTTAASSVPIASIVPATLASGVRMPCIREIGIFNNSGVAAEIGLGFPAAAGATITTSATVQPLNTIDPAGHTQLVTVFTTAPTIPSTFTRRAELAGVVGAWITWNWDDDEWQLWSGATISSPVIWQISSTAVTYDIYVKVTE